MQLHNKFCHAAGMDKGNEETYFFGWCAAAPQWMPEATRKLLWVCLIGINESGSGTHQLG
jgi:hypothetical protein